MRSLFTFLLTGIPGKPFRASPYTPISINVASEKNDAWSVFHSLRCIIVASLVNYVPATSLETQKANASNASMLCQQNVKTMYFKTLNPSLFNLRLCFDVRFFSVALCKCCKFSTSLLGSRTWEFWIVLKNQIQGVCWTTINNLTLRVYLFLRQFFKNWIKKRIALICFIGVNNQHSGQCKNTT